MFAINAEADKNSPFCAKIMKLAKWDDGYVFDADPRREDPLYYYMQEGGWGSAIGIEVAPPYEEHTASRVTIRVWPEHLPLEAALEADKRRDMYPRVVSVLLRRFPKWSNVTLQSSRIPELAEQGLVSAAFIEAGFSRNISTANEETWTRNSIFGFGFSGLKGWKSKAQG